MADQKKTEMEQCIIGIFQEHRRRYVVRRVAAKLKAKGIKAGIGICKVRKALNDKGLKAIQPRSFVPKTIDSRHPFPISPNLPLERSLPMKPDEVCAGDIT